MTKPIPYTGEESYIFVSYSHKNTDSVWEILNSLQREGVRFWYDDGIDPGESWDDYIAEHINSSGYLLAFISGDYSESDNCIQELRYAMEQKKPILLLRLDEHKLTPGLEMRLCSYQAILAYETDEEECLEKIMTAKDIGRFKNEKEETARRYLFKEKYPRLVKALKQSYYYEAIFQENELMDDLLYLCLFEMGFVATSASARIRDKSRDLLEEIASGQNCPVPRGIGTMENKLKIIRSVYRWANSAGKRPEDPAIMILKQHLCSGHYSEKQKLFSDIELWCMDSKKLTADILRNKRDPWAGTIASLASKGRRYANDLNNIYKEIRKTGKIRKAFKLK